ncbi:Lipase 3 precursor [Methyloligella halotolerans]|uniref:Lipase 3 n=1 Tax=Methyloligella halotolerans TaxID=1177755 RepID=A0A1E2RXC8_9HYPH|nr:alpha/beta hydrolase [Methyloligella halotolerans]ODA66896.1 Lipase 3 precursor [Methyloligella halotolerans]
MDQIPAGPSSEAKSLTLGDGRRMGYAEFGDPDGLPVLALHGTPGSRLTFTVTDDAARARTLRIIAPDRPGYGISDFKRFENVMDWVPDLRALADALELKGFAVMGVSGGGPYAVAAAAGMRKRTAFLALVSPVGPIAAMGGGLRLNAAHRRIFHELPGRPRISAAVFWSMRSMLRLAPNLAYRGLMRRAAPKDRPILEQTDTRTSLLSGHQEGLRRDVRGAAQDVRLFGAPWALDFESVIAPAVLWQGLEDRNVPPTAAEYLADQLPNCRLDVMPSAGHYWIFDHIEEVLDAVEASVKAGAGVAEAGVDDDV